MTSARHGSGRATTQTVHLQSGTLQLRVVRSDFDLDHLCGYASRRSRKRGFVFVSKVLGKHFPARPSTMRATHVRLAEKLANVAGPAVLIGMAETATGLAFGIYDNWLRASARRDVVALHTTRYRVRGPLALQFAESHSHATEHQLHQPEGLDAAKVFQTARTLVLVDDELSTGKTLTALARAYRQLNSSATATVILSLTDWLSSADRARMVADIGGDVEFHSLLEGEFTLAADPLFDPGVPPNVTGRAEFKDFCLPRNHGRLGLSAAPNGVPDTRAVAPISVGERVLVLGTGEFLHPPFRLAERLEAEGHTVFFQATTRSPLMVERDLTSVLEFVDNYHDAIPNYLYNVIDRHYDRIVIGYETGPLPADHRLVDLLGAQPILF